MKSSYMTAREAVSWIAYRDLYIIKEDLRVYCGHADYVNFGTTEKSFLRKFLRTMEKGQPLPMWHRYYFTLEEVNQFIEKSEKTPRQFRALLIQADCEQKRVRRKINGAIKEFLEHLSNEDFQIYGIPKGGNGNIEPVPPAFLRRPDIALGLQDNLLRILTSTSHPDQFGLSSQALKHIVASRGFLGENASSDYWGQLKVKIEDMLRLWPNHLMSDYSGELKKAPAIDTAYVSMVEAASLLAFDDERAIKDYIPEYYGTCETTKYDLSGDKTFFRKYLRAMDRSLPLPKSPLDAAGFSSVNFFTIERVSTLIEKSGLSLHEFRRDLVFREREDRRIRRRITYGCKCVLQAARAQKIDIYGIKFDRTRPDVAFDRKKITGEYKVIPVEYLLHDNIECFLPDNELWLKSHPYKSRESWECDWAKLKIKKEDVIRLRRVPRAGLTHGGSGNEGASLASSTPFKGTPGPRTKYPDEAYVEMNDLISNGAATSIREAARKVAPKYKRQSVESTAGRLAQTYPIRIKKIVL